MRTILLASSLMALACSSLSTNSVVIIDNYSDLIEELCVCTPSSFYYEEKLEYVDSYKINYKMPHIHKISYYKARSNC